MALDRHTPTLANTPAGLSDTAFAAAVDQEVYALWNFVPQDVNNVAGTNTITGDLAPAHDAWIAGQKFKFRPANANNGACTVNWGVSAKSLRKRDGSVLTGGELDPTLDYDLYYDGVVVRIQNYIPVATVLNALPKDIVIGLETSNDAGDLINDIHVATGSIRDHSNQFDLVLSPALTKRMDAGWAVGDAVGGQLQSATLAGTVTVAANSPHMAGVGAPFANYTKGDTITLSDGQSRRIASIATSNSAEAESNWSNPGAALTHHRGGKARNTCFRVFLIRKDSNGAIDVAFYSQDNPTPDLPTGWSAYRLIWHVLTDNTGKNRAYMQTLDYCTFVTPVNDITLAITAIGNASRNVTSNAPPASLAQLEAQATFKTYGAFQSDTQLPVSGSAFIRATAKAQYIGFPIVQIAGYGVPTSATNGVFVPYGDFYGRCEVRLPGANSLYGLDTKISGSNTVIGPFNPFTLTINLLGWKYERASLP